MDERSIMKYAMQFDIADFPETMCDMAEIGGIMQTLLYARRFGGTEFYVQRWQVGKAPNRETSNMLTVYRPQHVAGICKIFGGGRIHVKRCSKMMKLIKDMEINDLNDAGMPKIEVARITDCSMRHVRQVCNG